MSDNPSDQTYASSTVPVSPAMAGTIQNHSDSPISLEKLAEWVNNDNAILEASAMEAVNELVQNQGIKIRLMMLAGAKVHARAYARLLQAMDMVGERLLDPDSIKNMKPEQLLEIYDRIMRDEKHHKKALDDLNEMSDKVSIDKLRKMILGDSEAASKAAGLNPESRARASKALEALLTGLKDGGAAHGPGGPFRTVKPPEDM